MNTFTTNQQVAPVVAVDAAGDSIIAWQSFGQDGDGYGIFAQRFDAAGAKQGGEFQVNTFATGNQTLASVAMDSVGDFVITWHSSDGHDGDGYGSFARRYSAAGVALGGEIPVNTFTTGNQTVPSIAMDVAGDFVIAWNSYGQDGDKNGVFAQRFNAAGAKQGGEIPVNTFTTGNQAFASVAMDAGGDFVIAWASYDQDGSKDGVFAQRFNSAGTKLGLEFQANTSTTGFQTTPSVAMDANGDFVIAWQSFAAGGASYGIFARRYNALGAKQGNEFHANTSVTGSQTLAGVAMDSIGDFAITWNQTGSANAILAQRFSAAGVAQCGEIQVNSTTTGNPTSPSVAMDAGGNFIVSWVSSGPDGDGAGIFAQRFDRNRLPVATGIIPSITGVLGSTHSVALTSFFDDAEDGPVDLAYTIQKNTNSSLFASATINAAHQLVLVFGNTDGTASC